MNRLKTLTSHAAHFRFLAECDTDVFWMPRKCCPAKTPFSSGPTVAVRMHGNDYVWIAETAQRRYEVWKIDPDYLYNTEAEAEAEQFATTPALS